MPHDVFLSYASTDRAAADAICTALEARGIRCWIAPRDVPAGADWGEAILSAIGRAHAMVLVLSRTTANSTHVRNEVVTAVSQSLALCPVRIEDCQPSGALRLHLAGSHWINVFPQPVEQHADALAAGVRLALAADATIEIPRAQAAALVAAARAAHAAAQPPTAQPPAAPMPAAMSAPRPAIMPAPVPATMPGPAAVAPPMPPRAVQHAPAAPAIANPAAPGHGAGAGVVLALIAVALLVAIGAAAWLFEPRLRAMFGAATDAPAVLADAAPVATPPEASPPPAPTQDAPVGGAQGLSASRASLAGLGGPVALPGDPVPMPAAARLPQAPVAPPPGPARPAAIVPAPARPAARLTNVAAETIRGLFVSRVGEGIGREDWLGNAQLTPGNAVLIRAPQGQGCVFDIRAVYVGGAAEDRPGVDICAAPELRFEGSKGTGAPSSR